MAGFEKLQNEINQKNKICDASYRGFQQDWEDIP